MADDPQCARRAGENRARDYIEIILAFVAIFAAFVFLRTFDVLPRFAISEGMSYGVAFLIGLAASVSTCLAVTGGLLVALAAKYGEAKAASTSFERFLPHAYFNAGRILGYTVFGAAIGALGSAFSLSPEINGLLMIGASAVMIVLGLQILRVLPSLGLIRSLASVGAVRRIQSHTEGQTGPIVLLLGAATFFLPCGFTQALQLYVLAKGSAIGGALVMLAFSLGTLPALLSLSLVSSFSRGAFQRYFLKAAGAAVVVLGLVNVEYGLVLTGNGTTVTALLGGATSSKDARAAVVDGKQIIEMKVVGLDYEPNQFTVTAGVPVVWRISAEEAEGCGRVLIVPKLRVRRFLSPGATNIVAFTPENPGEIEFNCGMGMMTPNSKFIVVDKSQG